MSFDQPLWFWLYMLLIPLGLRYAIKPFKNTLPIYSSQHLGSLDRSWRQYLEVLPRILWVTALAWVVLALARPMKRHVETQDHEKGIAIEMLLDVSSSMDIHMDLKGRRKTRMEVAKRVLEEFVLGDGKALQGRSNDLIGIIAFARYADTICPLTMGHQALASMARGIEVNERPNEDGTAYGDAAALAAARLSHYEKQLHEEGLASENMNIKSKIMVLLTDGENNCGRYLPLQAAAMARDWNIKIYCISLGARPDDESVEVDDQSIRVEGSYTEAEWTLHQMATSTGGLFRRAHDYESLQSVYQEIDQLEKSEIQTLAYERKEPMYEFSIHAALCFMVLSVSLRQTVLRRSF